MILTKPERDALESDARYDAQNRNDLILKAYHYERDRARRIFEQAQEMDDVYTKAYYAELEKDQK